MANAVNNDPGRVRPVENYVRVRNYHETAEGACSGTFTGHALPTWRGLLRPSRTRHVRLRPGRRLYPLLLRRELIRRLLYARELQENPRKFVLRLVGQRRHGFNSLFKQSGHTRKYSAFSTL